MRQDVGQNFCGRGISIGIQERIYAKLTIGEICKLNPARRRFLPSYNLEA